MLALRRRKVAKTQSPRKFHHFSKSQIKNISNNQKNIIIKNNNHQDLKTNKISFLNNYPSSNIQQKFSFSSKKITYNNINNPKFYLLKNNYNNQNNIKNFCPLINSQSKRSITLNISRIPPYLSHKLQIQKFCTQDDFDDDVVDESPFGEDIGDWADLEQTIKSSGRSRAKSKEAIAEERETAIYEEFAKYQNHLLVNKPENILVSGPLRDRMWQLHISDPKVYTVYRLASQFRLEPNRVMAILYFRQKEKETELLSGKNASNLLEKEYAKRFPTTSDPNQPDMYLKTHLIPGMHWQALEDEVDEALHTAKVWGYNDRLPMWLRKKEFNPKVPPPEFAGPPKIFKGPTRSQEEIELDMKRKRIPKGGGKVIVIDTSKQTRDFRDLTKPEFQQNDWNRTIIVAEMDGTIREASWEERGRWLFSRRADRYRDWSMSTPELVKWDEKFYKFFEQRYKLSKEDMKKDLRRQMRMNEENMKTPNSRARAGGPQFKKKFKRYW